MIRIPTHRVPTHPSEMLLEEFLIPMGLTQGDLADTIAYKRGRVFIIDRFRRNVKNEDLTPMVVQQTQKSAPLIKTIDFR